MTRQKKEIIKKILEIERFVQVDIELGCGFAPAGTYAKEEQEVGRLYDQLASLRHYESAVEMMYDCRGFAPAAAPFA